MKFLIFLPLLSVTTCGALMGTDDTRMIPVPEEAIIEVTQNALVWEGMNFYQLGSIAPCVNGDYLYYYYGADKDSSLDATACPWTSPNYPAGDQPIPILLRTELYENLESENARMEAEYFQSDPSIKVEWGAIEDEENSHGIPYQTQGYRYEGDSLIGGIQTGTWVSILMPDGRKFLFDFTDGYEDQIGPFTKQFQ